MAELQSRWMRESSYMYKVHITIIISTSNMLSWIYFWLIK